MPPDVSAEASDRAAAVGAVIRRRREERGISLRAFARQCDLSPAHVSKIERGLASPSLVTLTRIVQELDLHGADLFGLASQVPGHVQVIRAADVPVLPVEDAESGSGAVRVAAQTPATTVLVGLGGPDHYLSPTISPQQVIVLILEGDAEARVGDELIALAAGDTLIIPPLAPHGIRITGGSRTRTVYITSEDSRMVFDA
jgi:quercetin dioxygenase-like cupin family protein/DNA-binding XRE family transcriptional regulator